MHLPVFEQAFLLKSLGWGIVNSLWQTAGLWLLYRFIIKIDKNLPSPVKYYLSFTLLTASFIWFVFTILQNYFLLKGIDSLQELSFAEPWAVKSGNFNNLFPFISVAYLGMFFIYFISFVRNLTANRFLQKNNLSKPPVDLRLFVKRTALQLGVSKKIQIWISSNVDVPSVTGHLKPIILLPLALINHLSVQQIESVLVHELAHIKRNDYLINLLQSVMGLALFFNPFAFLLSKAIREERENCCDDWVLTFQYDNYEYAQALLMMERQRQNGGQLAFVLAATNGKKNLLQRVRRLFNANAPGKYGCLQKVKLAVLSIFLLLSFVILLPCMTRQPINNYIIPVNQKEKSNLLKRDNYNSEKVAITVLQNNALLNPAKKEPAKVKRKSRQKKLRPFKPEMDGNGDYVNAYINEELINPVAPQYPVITSVVENEIKKLHYIVKIDEQQSGKKSVNTYYFELNNQNGMAAIKPLIILNKLHTAVKKAISVDLKDSLTLLKKLSAKKRVTS